MRCVIAGSRYLGTIINDRGHRIQLSLSECGFVEEAFTSCDWSDRITEIVSGEAKGIDNLGEQLAEKLGIDVVKFPADWDKYGNRAGHIRNRDMAKYTDIAIVIMVKGGSVGSKNMIQHMRNLKKPCMVFEVIGCKLCQVK